MCIKKTVFPISKRNEDDLILHETLVSEPQTDFCVCISLRADNAKPFTEGHTAKILRDAPRRTV